jgi:hypothetical protein
MTKLDLKLTKLLFIELSLHLAVPFILVLTLGHGYRASSGNREI